MFIDIHIIIISVTPIRVSGFTNTLIKIFPFMLFRALSRSYDSVQEANRQICTHCHHLIHCCQLLQLLGQLPPSVCYHYCT